MKRGGGWEGGEIHFGFIDVVLQVFDQCRVRLKDENGDVLCSVVKDHLQGGKKIDMYL